MSSPKITALAPWYGSNRMLAPIVGERLKGCRWVGVPFAGGMSELRCIDAPTLLVNDLHKHVINLARCVGSIDIVVELASRLSRTAFHPDQLEVSRRFVYECQRVFDPYDIEAAFHYFVCCWMGRSGLAGTDDEFKGGLPIRWTSSGGDSNVRYRSAIKSLVAWSRIMRRCNFTVMDFRDFLGKCKDQPQHGIYCDAPFPDAGDSYRHKFTEQDHRVLRDTLALYDETLVLIRYRDHPLIRELYPQSRWNWEHLDGRNSANNSTPEVLISNRKEAL